MKYIEERGFGLDVSDKDAELKGLEKLRGHKKLTSSEYLEITGVSEHSARRHLNDLIKAGKARKTGDGPSTEYHIDE